MYMIYVAGPIRAITEWERTQNIRKAEAVALELWKAGYAVHCPHKNTEGMSGACPEGTFLAGDLEILSRCDAMVLLEGWETSVGSKNEVLHANERRIPVVLAYSNLGYIIDLRVVFNSKKISSRVDGA